MIFITNDLFHLSSLLRHRAASVLRFHAFYCNSTTIHRMLSSILAHSDRILLFFSRFVQNLPDRTQRAPPKRSPHAGNARQRLQFQVQSRSSPLDAMTFLYHWNSCTPSIAEKSQMEKRILGLLCAKKTKQRPLRRPRRFRGRCHCGSGNAAGISLQTDSAWPCAGVPHFLRWAP